jgi:PAS domain S-box-containing protein
LCPRISPAPSSGSSRQALRQSEERYRTLIETSPDAVTYTDVNANIILANQQAASVVGLDSPDALLGRSSFEFIASEDRDRAFENARITLETGAVRSLQYTMLRPDGGRIPVEMSVSLLTDEQAQPRGFVGVTRDITERTRAEAALRRRDAILARSPMPASASCSKTDGDPAGYSGAARRDDGRQPRLCLRE